MKYFRAYPWGIQLLLFVMMIFTMVGFCSSMLYMLLPKFTPYNIDQLQKATEEHAPRDLVSTFLVTEGLFNVFLFLIPAFIFAYLTHPEPGAYLGLRMPKKKIHLLLAILIMIGATPVLQSLGGLISQIDFGAKVKASQAVNDNIIKAFLSMPDFASFIRAFIIIAIVPALGEEMFFRGVMLKFAKKRTRGMTLPIVFTAAVFAYSHTNIYGLLSIFLAGVLLAVLYNLTGSLWCSIGGHLFFNGSQVITAYAGNSNPAVKSLLESDIVPWYLVTGGAVVFCVSFYLLWKSRTPLPADWTSDFAPGEVAA